MTAPGATGMIPRQDFAILLLRLETRDVFESHIQL